jgi:hypothetical protein
LNLVFGVQLTLLLISASLLLLALSTGQSGL